tara:strand:- start:846 stop:2201 length:1356 start_codon:yes stop_codon:yes gene_type:complete
MAQKDLKNVLKKVEKAIETNSTAYRRLVSDKKVHSITVSVQKITTQVKREMESRIGVEKGKLQKTIVDVIDIEVPKMVTGMYNDVKGYNNDAKFSEVSELIGNATRFTFVLAAKPGRTANIFNAFRKVKQDNQKVLLKKLRAAIRKLNKGRTEGNQIRQIGRNFLDIGHQDGSAVSTQRKQAAQAALFEFGMNTQANPVISRFLKEVQDVVNLSISKKDGEPVDIIEAELESKYLNRKRGGGVEKALALELAKDLDKIMETFNASEYANLKGSDSKLEKATKALLNPFAKKAAANPKIKTNFKSEKEKTSNTKVKAKPKKSKATLGGRKNLTTIDKTPIFDTKSRRSMFSFIAMINKKLPRTVEKNMRAPRLENQSGRFARSVEIKDVIQTRKGFPSFGYTYDKEPYQVFEVGKGLEPWASPDRDPRRLIDGSIREIAADMALGRFFTRRL